MDDGARLARFIAGCERLLVLTGAGISTASGIPDYRDEAGAWKRTPPIDHREFVASAAMRQRYWARSMAGWPRFDNARPNATHDALAALERAGRIDLLITQNVDGLHQRAGSTRVIDLHGCLDTVICLDCAARQPRRTLQERLLAANPQALREGGAAPDGDADLPPEAYAGFAVPPCLTCGGVLKPDVVFFGDNVPRARVEAAFAALDRADGLLVLGSSLMVYSGYRFCERAHRRGIPIAAVNRGQTRADALLLLKITASCEDILPAALSTLAHEKATPQGGLAGLGQRA